MNEKYFILIVFCIALVSCRPERAVNTIFMDSVYADRVKVSLRNEGIEFMEESELSIWYSEKLYEKVEKIIDEMYRNLPKYFTINNFKLKEIMVDGLNKNGIPYKIEVVSKEESKISVEPNKYEAARVVFRDSLSKFYSEP